MSIITVIFLNAETASKNLANKSNPNSHNTQAHQGLATES